MKPYVVRDYGEPENLIGYKFVDTPKFIERGSVRLRNGLSMSNIDTKRADRFDGAGVVGFPESGVAKFGNGLGYSVAVGTDKIVARSTRDWYAFCMSWNPENVGSRKESWPCYRVDIAKLRDAIREEHARERGKEPPILGFSRCDRVKYETLDPVEGFVPGHPFIKNPGLSWEEELRLIFDDRRYDGLIECAPGEPREITIELGPRPDIFERL